MNAVEILPLILFIVVIVSSISQRIHVPYPIMLVVTGLVVGFIPSMPSWHPTTDMILPVCLPPILFASARLVSGEDIKRNLSTIGSLSVLLVIASALSIAWVLHALMPKLSFAAALVLGAIISPTDTTAATAILTRMNIRQHIIKSVEVESLFNDAMGIVLYKSALLLIFLGQFHIAQVGLMTLSVGLGGIAVGLIFAYFTRLITHHFFKDSDSELPIIMSLILAYVAYLFADHVGVSGVLAVVAAGLFHKKTEQRIGASARLAENSVWSTLLFFINGLLFIAIGMQFQSYWLQVKDIPTTTLLLFIAATIGTMTLLRAIWVTATFSLNHLLQRSASDTRTKTFPFQRIFIVSWSGMRGLVSLALALALPEMLSQTTPFPHRNLVIFLTLTTILFTLLVQGLTLPLLIKKIGANKDNRAEIRLIAKIHDKLTRKALNNIQSLDLTMPHATEAKQLVEHYYANRQMHLIGHGDEHPTNHDISEAATALLIRVLQFERDELATLLKQKRITLEIYLRILRKIDRDEVGFSAYR